MTDPRPPLPTSSSVRPALGLLAGLGVSVLIMVFGVILSTLAAMRGADSKTFVAPAWIYPTHLIILFLGALAGGFTTARITSGRSMFTTLVLALILMMSALAPVLRHRPGAPGQPEWYALSIAIMSPLGALLGGILERRRSRTSPATA